MDIDFFGILIFWGVTCMFSEDMFFQCSFSRKRILAFFTSKRLFSLMIVCFKYSILDQVSANFWDNFLIANLGEWRRHAFWHGQFFWTCAHNRSIRGFSLLHHWNGLFIKKTSKFFFLEKTPEWASLMCFFKRHLSQQYMPHNSHFAFLISEKKNIFLLKTR